MTEFTARRAVLKSLIKMLIAVAVGTVLAVAFFALHVAEPEGFADKLLQCLYFCLFVIGELFAMMFFVDGLRDVLASPTVSLKDGVLKIFGCSPVNVSDIVKVEMKNLAKKEGKYIPAVAVYVKDEDEPRLIKKSYTGIPLDTVKYAIEVRLNNK